MDQNGDGGISLDEFVLACDVLRGHANTFVDVGSDFWGYVRQHVQRGCMDLQQLLGVSEGNFWFTVTKQEKDNTTANLVDQGSLTNPDTALASTTHAHGALEMTTTTGQTPLESTLEGDQSPSEGVILTLSLTLNLNLTPTLTLALTLTRHTRTPPTKHPGRV